MSSKKNNRSFGLLFFVLFLLIGLWPLINGGSPRIYFFPIAILFLILGLINSSILTPLNRNWVKFGELIGKIVAPIVMGIIYFAVLTPIGIFLRIFRKDLLDLKFSNKENSYWKKRIKDLGSMNKQF